VPEVKGEILFRIGALLWVQELQLVSGPYSERRARLGADADPVNVGRHRQRPVRLHRNFKTPLVEGSDKRPVELQQRLPSRSDEQTPCAPA